MNDHDDGVPQGTQPTNGVPQGMQPTNGAAQGGQPPDGTPAPTPEPPTSHGRLGAIRGRSRTRAEERIEALDASPAAMSAEVDALRQRLELAEQEAAENKAAWQRSAADFANYRRRTEQERLDLLGLASEALLLKVLALADDFDRAIAHVPEDQAGSPWVEGIAAIDRKLRQLLESEGVRPMEAQGQPFDPREHDAVAHVPTTEAPDGTVLRELQRGWYLRDRVLRPALVAVADNDTNTTTDQGAGPARKDED